MQRSGEPENGRTSCLRVSMECRMAGKGNASLQPAEHHRKTSSPPEGLSVSLFGRGREFFVLGG